jgi:tetratricopeptide (TPR) repeat protein
VLVLAAASPARAAFCPKRPEDPAAATAVARKMWSIADEFYRQGEYRKAMQAWLCSAKLYPKAPAIAYYNIGRAAQKAGEPAQAIRYYRRYLTKRPDAPERPKIEKALKRLRRLVALRPRPRPPPRRSVTPPPRPRTALKISGYVTLSLGGALAVAAAALSGLFWQAKATVEDRDGDALWNPEVRQAYDRYPGYRAGAWACAGLAAAAVATGAVLLVLGRKRRAERVSVAPIIGPGGTGLVIRARF